MRLHVPSYRRPCPGPTWRGPHAPLPAHAHERGGPEAASSTNSCGYTRSFAFMHASDVNHAVASIVIRLARVRAIVQCRLDFKSNALGVGGRNRTPHLPTTIWPLYH